MQAPQQLTDGLVAVVKQDCPTCQLVAPVLEGLASSGTALQIVSQDDPSFLASLDPIDDRDLEISYRLQVQAVPTLFTIENGTVVDSKVGWNRDEWRELTGFGDLGEDLPPYRPGCGSRTVEPGMEAKLRRMGVGTST